MRIDLRATQCSVYLILYVLYSMVSLVFPGTQTSQLLLLLFMLCSMYYTYRCVAIIKRCPNYIKWLLGLVVLFTSYGIIYLASSKSYVITEGRNYLDVSKIEYLKNIYISLLPVFAFYYFSIKGLITEKWIRVSSIVLLLLAMFLFIYSYQYFIFNDEFGRTEMTNNYGYAFVALFPLLCFWHKRPVVQIAFILTLLVFIVLSMKRGAIVVGVLCSLYFLFSAFRKANSWGKFGLIAIVAIILYFGLPILSDYIAVSERFQQRIMQTIDGDSSNRDMLYSTAIDHIIYQTTLLQFLFGTGADSTISVLSNYAHNDWLEIGVNQGIIGVIIYFLYFLSLFRTWLNSHKQDASSVALGLCVIVCFISTFFSMSYNSMDISLSICIGYSIALNNKRTPLARSSKNSMQSYRREMIK